MPDSRARSISQRSVQEDTIQFFMCPVCHQKGWEISLEQEVPQDCLRCSRCGEQFSSTGGFWDLFKHEENAVQAETVRFYECDYIHYSPTLHEEDSGDKFKLIEPLISSLGKVESILDIGCGGATLLRLVNQRLRPQVAIGADISRTMLRRSIAVTPDATFARFDVSSIPMLSDSIELGLMIDVVEHLPEPLRALKEVARVCKHLVSIVPLDKCIWGSVHESIRGELSRKERQVGHLHLFNMWRTKRLFEQAGFEILNYSIGNLLGFVPRLYSPMWFVSIARNCTYRLSSVLSACLWGGQMAILARRQG